MTTAAEFQAKVVKSVTNMGRLDAIINGDENTVVQTDTGPVPSIAKVVAELDVVEGPPGTSVEIRREGDYIQSRRVGESVDPTWINLIPLSDIRGNPGILDPVEAAAIVSAAETAAAVATAAAGSIAGGATLIDPYTSDGVSDEIPLELPVAAGFEHTVRLFVDGVPQGITNYTCDGSTTATWVGEVPAAGSEITGFHEVAVGAVEVTAAPSRALPNGRLLPDSVRTARHPDLYDSADVYKNGTSNDGPGLTAALSAARVVGHSSGVIRVTSNETVPVSDLLVTGGTIYIGAGATLTFDPRGNFDAPRWSSVFVGPGEVRGLTEAEAAWFGAVGNYDEAIGGGGAPTDDTAAFNRAIRAAQRVRALDQAYYITGDVLMTPTLGKPTFLEGRGWSKAGAGTRFYSGGGAGRLRVSGTLAITDPSANAEWGLRDLTVLPSSSPAQIGILIAGEGGVNDAVLTGLTSNIVENVTSSNFAINMAVRSVTKVRLRNAYLDSQSVAGKALEIGLSPGGATCSEVALEGTVLGQPGGTAGIGLYLDNTDVGAGSPALATLRGITLDDDTQIYSGLGKCIVAFCVAAPSKQRNMGDIIIAPGTKLQGTGGITSGGALYVDAKDGARISTIKLLGSQIESSSGDAIDMRITTSGSVYGEINDVTIKDNHFRYNKNRSGYFDGVTGLTLSDNHLQFCGATSGATAGEHFLLNQCRVVRANENFVSQSEAVTWAGLNTGIRIAGSVTDNVTTRGNAMGKVTGATYAASYPQSGDSADQPSIIAQV